MTAGLLVVQRHEVPVALEDVVLGLAGGVRPAQVEPPRSLGPGALRVGTGRPGHLEHRMPVADVVEDAVEQHAHPPVVASAHEGVEVPLVTESVVDVQVVGRVVAVGLRGEDRAELQSAAPQVVGVVQPVGQVPQPVHDSVGLTRLGLGAGEARGDRRATTSVRRATGVPRGRIYALAARVRRPDSPATLDSAPNVSGVSRFGWVLGGHCRTALHKLWISSIDTRSRFVAHTG